MNPSIQDELRTLIDRVECTQALVDDLRSSLEFYKSESERLREQLTFCNVLLEKNEELLQGSVVLHHLGWNKSGGTDSGVGTVEEQAHNEQHCHSTCCSYQPKGQHTFGPPTSPGHSRCAIRIAIGNSTVGIWGFFSAHRIILS